VIKEEEKNQSEQAKSDRSLASKKKEEKHFSKINSSDKDKGDISITQMVIIFDNIENNIIRNKIQSSFYKNTRTSAAKVINSEY